MKIIIMLIPITLAACQTAGSGNFCDVARPHRFLDSTVDAMTDREVNQELSHAEFGQKLCGWKP